MKNSIKKVASALAAVMIISASGAASLPVSAVTGDSAIAYSSSSTTQDSLNKTRMVLTKGYKFTLKLNGSTSGVKYTSANPKIATVDSKGKVVGKSVGNTIIYVTKGSNVYSCSVQVVATKISTSKSSVVVDEGDKQKVTVQAKGEKLVKATSDDKEIATVSWSKSWNDDKITLYISGHKAGTTIIRLYNPNYPDVVKSIKVTVSPTGTIYTDTQSLTTKAGSTASFNVYGDASGLTVFSSDTRVASAKVTKKNGYFTVTVTGNSSGSAAITVYNKSDRTASVLVPVTVSSNVSVNSNAKYYVEKEYNLINPASMTIEARSETDRIVYWADEDTSKLMYMLVPYNYTGLKNNEYIVPVTSYVNNDTVIYDGTDYYWYLFAQDSGYFSKRRLDIAHPQNNTVSIGYGDKLVWDITSNGMVEYMVVPEYSQVDLSQYKYVLNFDGSSYFVKGNYYKVVNAVPRKKVSSDVVLSWNTYTGQREYMLVPANYDKVRAETVRAKNSGEYQYYTVYSSKPRKTSSSDIIIDFYNDNAEEYRYILVPRNYNEDKVDNLIDSDVASTSSSYQASNIQDIIDSINAERRSCGISSFSTDVALTEAAGIRAKELSEKFSHKRPDNTSYVTALEEAGVAYTSSEEIILRNMDYPSDVLETVFEDSDYRDTLLKSRNKKIGVAYNSDRDYYVIIVTD